MNLNKIMNAKSNNFTVEEIVNDQIQWPMTYAHNFLSMGQEDTLFLPSAHPDNMQKLLEILGLHVMITQDQDYIVEFKHIELRIAVQDGSYLYSDIIMWLSRMGEELGFDALHSYDTTRQLLLQVAMRDRVNATRWTAERKRRQMFEDIG